MALAARKQRRRNPAAPRMGVKEAENARSNQPQRRLRWLFRSQRLAAGSLQRYPEMTLFCSPKVTRPAALPWGKTRLPRARHPSHSAIFWRLGGACQGSPAALRGLDRPPKPPRAARYEGMPI